MTLAGLIAGALALVWAYAEGWMVAVALFRRWRRARRHRTTLADTRRWLLVRPCAGSEPELERALTSVLRRADNLDLEVVFAVSYASDPARGAAEHACTRLRAAGLDARVEVVPPTGPNRKASTLAGVVKRRLRDHAGVINVDSNVDMTDLDLASLVAPMSSRRVGATWIPPVERDGATLGDRASNAVLTGSFHTFSLLAALDPTGLVGKVFAIRRRAVDAADLPSLSSYLGEDVEVSNRLREAGYVVEPVDELAHALPSRRRFTDTVSRHARWIAVVRAQRPVLLLTYPLLFAPTPILLLLSATALLHSGWLALVAAGAALAARMVVSAGARFASRSRWHPGTGLVDAVLGDLVLWAALLRALASREVEWRGVSLRIDRLGRLHAV